MSNTANTETGWWRKQDFLTYNDNVIGWQLCPKCNSDGNLFRYNSPSIIGTGTDTVCDVCKGKKIINIETGLPPL